MDKEDRNIEPKVSEAEWRHEARAMAAPEHSLSRQVQTPSSSDASVALWQSQLDQNTNIFSQ